MNIKIQYIFLPRKITTSTYIYIYIKCLDKFIRNGQKNEKKAKEVSVIEFEYSVMLVKDMQFTYILNVKP